MSIDDFVLMLSEREKEFHKDFIAECRRREAAIKDAQEKSLKGVEIIEDHLLGQVGEFVFFRVANKRSFGRC